MIKKGTLTVGHGPMFSGKTNWLIQEYGDGKGVLAFKPDIDTRYTTRPVLRSHSNQESPAILISLGDIEVMLGEIRKAVKNRTIRKIVVDEANFFPDDLADVLEVVLKEGVDVSVAGLLTDSERKDFGSTRALLKMADEVKAFTAHCDGEKCEVPAIYTYAKKQKQAQIVVGAGDIYGAACEAHYDELAVLQNEKSNDFSSLIEYGVYPGFIDWLSGMKLPLIRKKREVTFDRQPHMEVGGDSMRVGKTTALTALKDVLRERGFRVSASKEDWQHNPYVMDSYGDSSETILKSQRWFARRKFEQLQAAKENETHIQDVHPEMDFCYAVVNVLMGRMTLKQFEEYVAYYYALEWERVPAPDLLVYLTASDKVLIERAKKTAREFEAIDERYFLIMKAVNRKWLEAAKKKYSVLEINTDDFDFATQHEAKEKLAELVAEKLKNQGWPFQELVASENNYYTELNGVLGTLREYDAVLMVGLPGSGKSYVANKLKKDLGYTLLSSDVEREKISGEERFGLLGHAKNSEYSKLAYKVVYEKAKKKLLDGNRVVVDATNLKDGFADYVNSLKEVSSKVIVCVVKSDESVMSRRMKLKKGMANKKESYYEGWVKVHGYFRKSLAEGVYSWPDEDLLGVRVVEVWNN